MTVLHKRRLHVWENPVVHPEVEDKTKPVHVVYSHEEFDFHELMADGTLVIGHNVNLRFPENSPEYHNAQRQGFDPVYVSRRPVWVLRPGMYDKIWYEEYAEQVAPEQDAPRVPVATEPTMRLPEQPVVAAPQPDATETAVLEVPLVAAPVLHHEEPLRDEGHLGGYERFATPGYQQQPPVERQQIDDRTKIQPIVAAPPVHQPPVATPTVVNPPAVHAAVNQAYDTSSAPHPAAQETATREAPHMDLRPAGS